MKYSILPLFLFIIRFPGQLLGVEFVKLSEPVNAVIKKSFKSDCHLKDFFDEVGAYQDYAVKVAGNINTKVADHKSKPTDLLTPMCRKDSQLRSSLECLIKKACNPTAPQSEIVQQIIDRTCSNLVPRVLKSWWDGKGVDIN